MGVHGTGRPDKPSDSIRFDFCSLGRTLTNPFKPEGHWSGNGFAISTHEPHQ